MSNVNDVLVDMTEETTTTSTQVSEKDTLDEPGIETLNSDDKDENTSEEIKKDPSNSTASKGSKESDTVKQKEVNISQISDDEDETVTNIANNLEQAKTSAESFQEKDIKSIDEDATPKKLNDDKGIPEISSLDLDHIGAPNYKLEPSGKIPDQDTPDKYFNMDISKLMEVVRNNIWYTSGKH